MFCHQLFDDDEGPNVHRLDRKGDKVNALATEAVEELRLQKQALTALTSVVTITAVDPRKRQREEALCEARKARAAKPKKLPRRVALTDARDTSDNLSQS